MIWEENGWVEDPGELLSPEWTRLPPLGAREAQVYALRASGDADLPARARQLLSAAEIERAERIRVTGAREEFIVGRAALRVLLAAATGRQPKAVAIETDSFGKPWLPGVHCNVSHSRGLIYVAICRAAPVGVDVEWIDPELDALEIGEANFSTEEAAALAAAPAGMARARMFCRLWTRKEAVAKAHGRGLQIPLRSIHVPDGNGNGNGAGSGAGNENRDGERAWIDPEGLPETTRLPAGAEFAVWELSAPTGFAAALAVAGAALPVRFVVSVA